MARYPRPQIKGLLIKLRDNRINVVIVTHEKIAIRPEVKSCRLESCYLLLANKRAIV
jgi:hypothetical protein